MLLSRGNVVPRHIGSDGLNRIECLLMAVISMGRRNTLTKTQNTARMLMNLKETLKSHSSRESGAVGPLEASRGAEVARASD